MSARDAMAALVAKLEPGLLLDVGCAAEVSPGAVGIDVDLEALRSLATDGRRVVSGVAMALPLRSACVDVAMARGLFHHLTDHIEVLRGFARVLRPGGSVVVLDAEPQGDDRFAEMTNELASRGHATEPRNGVAVEEFGRALLAAGFERCSAEQVGIWQHSCPPWTDAVYSSPAWLHHGVRR